MAAGVAYYGGTTQVGLYTTSGIAGRRDRFAVNLLNRQESAIEPAPIVAVGGRDVAVGAKIDTATPELWRWFAGAALVILMVEWWVYNRRVAA